MNERIAALRLRFPVGLPGQNRFSLKEQIFFAKRLSFLVAAGVPLIECLSIMRSQTKGAGKVRVVDAIIADIANGQYLATSLGKHRRFFDDF